MSGSGVPAARPLLRLTLAGRPLPLPCAQRLDGTRARPCHGEAGGPLSAEGLTSRHALGLPSWGRVASHSGSYASTPSASTSDRRITKSRLTPHVAPWSSAACNSRVNAVTVSKPSFS